MDAYIHDRNKTTGGNNQLWPIVGSLQDFLNETTLLKGNNFIQTANW